MNNIKAIFCDINGVLFEQGERFSDRYSKEFGVPVEKLSEFFDHDFDLCLTGKTDLKIRLAEFLNQWKWRGTVDELLDYWFGMEVPAYRELVKYIGLLRENQIMIFLATQNEKYRTARFLELLKPLLKYDHLIATYQIGYKKSNPLYFSTCLEQYNLRSDEVVLLDDNPKAINSAESIGLRTILFENESQTISDLKILFGK
jgi:HAD superfamily hydrolase (TIGR01509 family)